MSRRGRLAALGAALIAPPLMIGLVLMLAIVALIGGTPRETPAGGCTPTTPAVPAAAAQSAQLTPEQARNAAAIIGVGQQLGVPPRGWVVAIATALQESSLHNYNFGDRDSVGLFQQRTSQGWGSIAQIRNPRLSAEAFFGRAPQTDNTGLLDIGGWQQMPVTVAAQAVQRSALPSAYAAHETQAVSIVSKLAGGRAGTVDLASLATDPACAGGTTNVAATGAWTNPVPSGYVHQDNYGSCGSLWSSCHTGDDLSTSTGTEVVAAAGGVVESAGWGGAYGNLVVIRHQGGVETYYGHLSAITVREGQTVKAGQPIGAVGDTGNTTGPHLHFETRVDGQPTDPVGFMAQRGVRL